MRVKIGNFINTYFLEHQGEYKNQELFIKGKIRTDSNVFRRGDVLLLRTSVTIEIKIGAFSSALPHTDSKISRRGGSKRQKDLHISSELRQIRLSRRETESECYNEYQYDRIAR